VHFAILVYGVQYAASCDLAVDGDRDRRSDIAILKELSVDTWKALTEMTNQLAYSFSGHVNPLDAAGKFA